MGARRRRRGRRAARTPAGARAEGGAGGSRDTKCTKTGRPDRACARAARRRGRLPNVCEWYTTVAFFFFTPCQPVAPIPDFPDFERPQQALVAGSRGKRRHVSPPLRNLERLFQLDPWRRWGAGAFFGGGGAESASSCQLAPTPPSAWTLDQHTLCRCGKTSGALRTLSIAAGSSDGRRPRHEGPRQRKL